MLPALDVERPITLLEWVFADDWAESHREALTLAGRVLFFSDRPGRVILEYPNDIECPRRSSDPRVEVLQERLLAAHPNLLSGFAAGGEDPVREDTTLAIAPGPRAVP